MFKKLCTHTFAVVCVAAAAAAPVLLGAPAADAATRPAVLDPIPGPIPVPGPIPASLTCTTSVSGATGTAVCSGQGEVLFFVVCSESAPVQTQLAPVAGTETLTLTCPAPSQAVSASTLQVRLVG